MRLPAKVTRTIAERAKSIIINNNRITPTTQRSGNYVKLGMKFQDKSCNTNSVDSRAKLRERKRMTSLAHGMLECDMIHIIIETQCQKQPAVSIVVREPLAPSRKGA